MKPPADMPPPPGHPDFNKEKFEAWVAKMEPQWGEVAMALLRAGANPNTPDAQGMAPLMLACDHGMQQVASALVQSGANPMYSDKAGVNALIMSCFFGHTECARVLLGAGVPADSFSNDGCSALIVASA